MCYLKTIYYRTDFQMMYLFPNNVFGKSHLERNKQQQTANFLKPGIS